MTSFSSKRRPNKLPKIIFDKYVYRREVLKFLALDYKRSIPWIRDRIREYEPIEKIHNPRPVVIVSDATFYGRRKDRLGTLVFKDILQNEILIWKHIETETKEDYRQLLNSLLFYGYDIQAVIFDGLKGLYKVFKDYPIQMCHFHQKKTIIQYLTKNPKLEIAIELQKLMYSLTKTTEDKFTKRLNKWHTKYENILYEKTINSDTNKSSYTHPKVVSAYRNILYNLSYLFTYKKYNIKIHNTTNAIDGGVFSPMKKLMKIHNGFTKSLKIKMADDYLVNYKK